MPKLFGKRVVPADSVVILSELERAESTNSLDVDDAVHGTPQNQSGALRGSDVSAKGGVTNKSFDDSASETSLHSDTSGETLGIDASENALEDDHGMKVQPSLRGDAGLAVVNAEVGEKLATSGKVSNGYSMGKMLGRNGGSKVYVEENSTSVSETMDGGRVGGKDNEPVDDEEAMRCGWFSWRPNCIQVFNNPKGYLVFLCLLALIQNMTVLGYLNVVLTTLERRFRLSSVRSGFVVTAYDISNLIVCAFVTYFAERGRKPLWVGWGSMIFSLGSVIFALPHFLAAPYQYGVTEDEVCPAVINSTNGTSADTCADVTSSGDSLQPYYWLFILGQVLHGWGGSTLYTLGITYMDESLPSGTFGLYMGIFTAMNAVGPALGYIIGGVMLSDLYTDVLVPIDSLSITPDNPVWVGAWWLGFITNGALLFITALLYLGFPKKLPVSDQVLDAKKVESHQAGCEFESRDGYAESLRDFPRALGKLLLNAPFVCISGMATAEWFVYAGLTSFGPKFFESQFNISAGDASNDIGVISVVAGIVGSIASGVMMKRLNLSVKGLLKMSLACVLVALGSQFVFIFHCPDVPFAGVTVPYSESAFLNETNLASTCNSNCACPDTFDPVCGEDNVLYYTACHAGCTAEHTLSDGTITYSDCSCLVNGTVSSFSGSTYTPTYGGSATRGRCAKTCGHRWIFYLMMFISFLSTSMLIVPAWTATLRCVAHSLRGFALGLQTVMYGALGTVPAPVVFGYLIDKSCLLWQTDCDGSKSCWLYDNQRFSHSFLLITVVFKALTFLFCLGALCTYRPASKESESSLGVGGTRQRKISSVRMSTKANVVPYPIDT